MKLDHVVSPQNPVLHVGESVQLAVMTVNAFVHVRWDVEPKNIARIAPYGLLEAKQSGSATIAAFVDDKVLVLTNLVVK